MSEIKLEQQAHHSSDIREITVQTGMHSSRQNRHILWSHKSTQSSKTTFISKDTCEKQIYNNKSGWQAWKWMKKINGTNVVHKLI